MSCLCPKNALVRTGVFPLKEIITVPRFVRFMNHRSLKPEIFQTPVNEPHCSQHISGEFHSASIGVSDGIANSHRWLSQPVPLPTRFLILNIELLNMPALRLDCPLFLQSDSKVIALMPHDHSHSLAIHHSESWTIHKAKRWRSSAATKFYAILLCQYSTRHVPALVQNA